jgi:carbonic anhydrase/acetyltransferase-like protein (isoleucine patch superfamily)
MPARRLGLVASLCLGSVTLSVAAALLAAPAGAQPPEETCSPVAAHRPVCEVGGGGIDTAAFLDPTVVVLRPRSVELSEHVYVAPFARLDARSADLFVGPESNLQDNVTVVVAPRSAPARTARLRRVQLQPDSGVQTGERVILAHGSAVRGPARLGVGPPIQVPDGMGGETEDSGVFVSFGAMVDGAVLERDSGLSTLSRVGPGVRLRSGLIVLPGKNVTTQEQADDPALGKVRPIVEADREFNAGVVEVNVGLAREYARLATEGLSNVRGINVDPGGNVFDQARDLPAVESALCAGQEVRVPRFRNRIIGDVCFEDSLRRLDRVMGGRISLRADEGGPFGIGAISRMDDRVIFHALESNDLNVGNRVRYGKRVIVHGGGRPQIDPTTGLAAPTVVGNDVALRDDAVVFRSLVRNGVVVGRRSAVVGSELSVGQRIPASTIYANDAVFGPVEW